MPEEDETADLAAELDQEPIPGLGDAPDVDDDDEDEEGDSP